MAIQLHSVKQDREVAVAEAISQLSSLKAQLAELKKQEKFLAGIIQRTMGSEEILTDGDDTVLCTWKWSERISYDTKKLAEDLPDIADEYKSVKQIRTFRLS